MLANVLRTGGIVARSSTRYASTLDPKIAAKMKKYQKNIEGEVYLMGGTSDKILFAITAAGVAFGSAYSFVILYRMANPK